MYHTVSTDHIPSLHSESSSDDQNDIEEEKGIEMLETYQDYINENDNSESAYSWSDIDSETSTIIDTNIYINYFVIKSSKTKLKIRLNEYDMNTFYLKLPLKSGLFNRNAVLKCDIKCGSSHIQQLQKNNKLKHLLFDIHDDTSDIIKISYDSCLNYINNLLVYNMNYRDIILYLQYTYIKT
eukprot:269978_1